MFFPFPLFGSPGAAAGAELLADAFRELLADNRRERMPTRARAYQHRVRRREFAFETLADCHAWRQRARQAIRQAWKQGEFLLWVGGNHVATLPLLDELAGSDTLVIQLDAHLDVYNLTDCTSELSHGNFLLHCDGPLPPIINVGHRELLLPPEHVGRYYRRTIPATELLLGPKSVLDQLRTEARQASRVLIDLDCDVFDPATFPAAAQAMPLGLTPALVLSVIDAVWSDRLLGVAFSEFDPSRDRNDECLSLLMWLIEYLLLRWHER